MTTEARSLPRPTRVPAFGEWVPFITLNLLGAMAFLHPFFSGAADPDSRWFEHATDAPLVFGGLAGLCLLLVVADMANGRLDSKTIAGLGVLAAMAAILRTVTLPAGANLFWTLVIAGGWTLGPRLGFLLGALALVISAFITGGIGPWMPFQAFAAAWVGLAAGLGGGVARSIRPPHRLEIAGLAFLGAAAAIFYGIVINLWSWPFFVGGPDISYQPGLGAAEAVRRYGNYYLVTSFGWDLVGSICNALALGIAGGPLVRALKRFRERFSWQSVPVHDS
ncbi:MAG: ECF transporter S component [Dehalococcoidia bacterium]